MLPLRRSAVCSRCLVHINRAVPSRQNSLSILSQLGKRNYSSDNAAEQGSKNRLRVAIIGSGPAGFYAAHRLMRGAQDACVDMYEQLPVPFGLVRYGVAPDHPEVKNCQAQFSQVASSPHFNFVGNIAVGTSLPVSALKPHYDAILFSYGASEDRELGIPNENKLKGIYSARAFVGWYNGLPEYRHLDPDLSTGEDAVIIGQGNVALDVARALLKDVDALRKTDMADYALERLSKSTIKRVRIVGRRGPMQASFSNMELREIIKLPSIGFQSQQSLDLLPPQNLRSQFPRIRKRAMEIFVKGSLTPLETASKTWSLNYLLSPNSFHSSPDNPDHLSHITFTRNQLDPSNPYAADSKASPLLDSDGDAVKTTGRASHCFRSIGYKSLPLPGFDELNIPFDTRRGLIPNDGQGRIIHMIPSSSSNSKQPDMPIASHLAGLYCAGWVKRGPIGVIASTMEDAFTTADAIVRDWTNFCEGSSNKPPFLNTAEGGSTGLGWEGVRPEAEKLGLRPTTWSDWKHLNNLEKERGKARGKLREKFSSVEEMIDALP